MEVRDLFYNVPARKKFLRTEATEFKHIEALFKNLALSNPGVGFGLSHNHKQLYQLNPAGRTDALDDQQSMQRLARLCGQEFSASLISVNAGGEGVQLRGWVALPTFSRSQADMQHFYVNQRMVRDKLVSHAVRQAYRDVLYHGRHPAYVLYLRVDPRLVDVNVHPTKHEVRFRDGRLVHDFLFRTLHRVLSQTSAGGVVDLGIHQQDGPVDHG